METNIFTRPHAVQVSGQSYMALHSVSSQWLGRSLPARDMPLPFSRWDPAMSRLAGWGRIALFILPIFTSGTAVVADDAKTFPGVMCQPSTNTDPIVQDSNGRMFNIGAVPQTWICPIVRDTMREDTLRGGQIAVMGSVRCDLRTRDALAGNTNNKSGTVEGAFIKFGRAIAGGSNIVSARGGYYFFRCEVAGGGRSGVVSYRVDEDE